MHATQTKKKNMSHDAADQWWQEQMSFFSLFVLHLGRVYLRPKGNLLYSANRGWVQSKTMACAFLAALALYKSESSFSPTPVILLPISAI